VVVEVILILIQEVVEELEDIEIHFQQNHLVVEEVQNQV
jgi:hypothetical protein